MSAKQFMDEWTLATCVIVIVVAVLCIGFILHGRTAPKALHEGKSPLVVFMSANHNGQMIFVSQMVSDEWFRSQGVEPGFPGIAPPTPADINDLYVTAMDASGKQWRVARWERTP